MTDQNRGFRWFKLIPAILIILGLIAFFYFRLYRFMTFQNLQTHRVWLKNWTSSHFFLSTLVFCGIYILMVAFSLPNALLLTLLGGFLFGPFLGSIYVICSATLGAILIFLAAKTLFHDLLLKKMGNWHQKLEQGFKKNAVSYLLFLRLVPLFPFWLINIAAAFFNITLRTFFLTTFFGIIPGSIVYVLLGNGLGVVFDQGQTPNMNIIFKPAILIPILGLALLSLVPIIYKKVKAHGKST